MSLTASDWLRRREASAYVQIRRHPQTKNTQHITTPPEDRATAAGDTRKKFSEDWTCSSKDMFADRQTHAHTDTVITILCFPIGGRVTFNARTEVQQC